MKKITLISIGLAITIVLLNRCAEEGCQRPSAINYCEDCTKDGENCIFEADVTFYYDSATAVNLLFDDVDTLYYYFDEELMTKAPIGKFYREPPACGSTEGVSGKVRLDNSLEVVRYSIKDKVGSELMYEVATLKSNECQLIPLYYSD